jgi:membrane-associated phospholipid phosphatase
MRRLLARLGPDVALLVCFMTVLFLVGHLYGAHYHVRLWTMLLPGMAAPGIILVRLIARAPVAPARTLRAWLPLVLVAAVFDNLEDYSGVIGRAPIDDRLYQLDLAAFGAEPTVAIAKLYHPLLTDWMAACYSIFFITPMFLAIVLCLRGRDADFRELATSVMLQMWIGFFLWIYLPAGPPRYYPRLRDTVFQVHIPSRLGLNDYLQSTFDTYDPLLVRSAFPSLHCAYGLLTAIYAWRLGDAVFPRHRRRFFWIILPLQLSLFVSTIYLRHHWIPDCIAGCMVALTACALAPVLWRRWPRRIDLSGDDARAHTAPRQTSS